MILDRIDLRGFGSLRDRCFDFTSGLNLIVGPNEAGKSTLLQAIQAFLYGFFKDSNNWAGGSILERFEPWAGEPYGGALHLQLANGNQYQIDRNLAKERTIIYRNPGGVDVTSSFASGRHGWVDFADRYLGLTPPVFRASAWIGQGELRLTDPAVKALHGKLETLVDSGGAEQNAQVAMDHLVSWLKDRVNPNAVVVAYSPLKTAEQAVMDLSAELERSQRGLDELATMVADEMALAALVAARDQSLTCLDGYIAWHEAHMLDGKLCDLAELNCSIAEARSHLDLLTDVAHVTEAMLDAAGQAVREVCRLAEVVRQVQEQVDTESADCQRTQAELNRVDDDLFGLSRSANVSLADLSAAQDAVNAWNDATVRQREADDAIDSAHRRRDDWQASLDPRLVGRTNVDVVQLSTALNNAAIRRKDLAQAMEKSAAPPGNAPAEAELAALENRLGDLSAAELAIMGVLESELKVAAARHSNSQPLPVLPIAAVAALVGLVVGYVAAGLPGAIAGAIILGALAFVGLSSRSRDDEGTQLEKRRGALVERLRPFGVESVAELQRLWNDRSTLRDRLGDLRDLRSGVDRARTAYEQACGDIDKLIQVTDPDEARRVLEMLEAWATRKAGLERDEQQAVNGSVAARGAVEQSRGRARTILAGLGLAADSPTEAKPALQAFSADWETRSGLLQSRTTLGAKLAGYTARVTTLNQDRQKLADAEALAATQLKAVGIEAGAVSWEEDLVGCRQRFDDYQNWWNALHVQSEKRKTLIGTDDPSGWPARANELRLRALPPLDGDVRSVEELRAAKDRSESILATDRERLIRLATQREEKSLRFADPANLEEQLAEATTRLARIKRLGDGLRDARELIRITAEEQRRDYAPRLEQNLSDWLGRATDERYSVAHVSPEDLTVKLTDPHASGLVAIDSVSQGTRDAVALLLRVAMVDLLSNSTEPVPLFLDDPLVHVDPDRTQRILDVLSQISKTRQIFFVTQDPRMEDWVAARGDCVIQRLDRPS